MNELTIKFCGREVMLKSTERNPDIFRADLGPMLGIEWSGHMLALWANQRLISPMAAGDDAQAAAAKLEQFLGPLRQLFRAWEVSRG